MKEHKNIDRLFQEKFRDFEQEPPTHLWNNISNALYGKPKNNRRILGLWLSGIAAGLAILFFLNNPFTTTNTLKHNTNKTKENNIHKNTLPEIAAPSTTNKEIITIHEKPTDINKTTPSNKEIEKNSFDTSPTNTQNEIVNNSVLNNNTDTKTKKRNSPSKNKELKNPPTFIALDELKEQNNNLKDSRTPNDSSQTKNEVAQTSKKGKDIPIAPEKTSNKTEEIIADKNSVLAEQPTSNTLESLSQNTTGSDEIIVENTTKWIVSTTVAPILFNTFENTVSSIGSKFDNNTKQGQLSTAYGVQLAYQINDRFTVQTGVHRVDYGYKTSDVYVSPGRYANSESSIAYEDLININDIKPSPPSSSDQAYQETGLKTQAGDLMQVFGYYEVPFEAKYSLKKGKIGISILSGFSTLILNKDEIYYQTDEISNKVNKTSELNSLHLSGNLGLELDLKIYKNVHFNATPIFKIHTNTFKTNTDGFNPYAIGVYSGLNFRF